MASGADLARGWPRRELHSISLYVRGCTASNLRPHALPAAAALYFHGLLLQGGLLVLPLRTALAKRRSGRKRSLRRASRRDRQHSKRWPKTRTNPPSNLRAREGRLGSIPSHQVIFRPSVVRLLPSKKARFIKKRSAVTDGSGSESQSGLLLSVSLYLSLSLSLSRSLARSRARARSLSLSPSLSLSLFFSLARSLSFSLSLPTRVRPQKKFCVGTRHGPALSSCTSMGKALRR